MQDNSHSTAVHEFLAQFDGPISYQRNPHDLGCYGSTNVGIRRARGEFVHILHDDDWIGPGFYAVMRAALEANPTVHAAAGACWLADREGFVHRGRVLPNVGVDGILKNWPARLAKDNELNLVTTVVRRWAYEAAGLFREDMPFAADWAMWRKLSHLSWLYVPTVTAYYRQHAEQGGHAMRRAGMAQRETEAVKS